MEVRLKPGHVDPEGETTKVALVNLRYDVEQVGTAKVYEINLNAKSLEEAKREADEMCRKLLANPVKDDYKIEVEEIQ